MAGEYSPANVIYRTQRNICRELAKMKDSTLTRCSIFTALGMVILAPVVIWGAMTANHRMRNAPINWIPLSYEQRQIYQHFIDRFQTEEYIVVSWPGCTVDDNRLEKLADAIVSDRTASSGEHHKNLFRQVLTGYDMVRQLQDEPLELSRKKALSRLRGSLVGPDGRTSCAVVVLTEHGVTQNKASIDAIIETMDAELGMKREFFCMAGAPVDGRAIDVESSRSIRYFMVPSTLMVLLLCGICLRSWPLTLAVLITAIFGQGLVLAFVQLSGVNMNAVLTVMAPLVFVLTVSAGVHLVNYYRDEVRLRHPEGATQRALTNGWLPCVLAAITTAIGLGSLMVSEIVPVRHFGIFAAIGILGTTAVLFLLLPGAMVRWPVRMLSSVPASHDPRDDESPSNGIWEVCSAIICRHATWIAVVCVAWMAFSAWGLGRIQTSIKVLNLLVPDSITVRDYRWMEKNIGPMVPIEIVLQFPADSPLDVLERVELVRNIQREIGTIEDLDGTMSAATFVPSIPASGGVRQTARRGVIRKQLKNRKKEFVDAHFLHIDDDKESWRISVRAPALGDLDYGLFLQRIRQQVEPALAANEEKSNSSVSAMYTGIMPLVFDVQRSLLRDLIFSYMTALVLVALIMIAVLRSVGAGLVAMLPNMFPTVVLFGSMAWMNKPVDIGSMMTASVALGIAVDGTLHFLNWFRREINNGHSQHQAVALTFRHCARAITQTAFICGVGLLIYSLSGFVPTRRFAWMMFALLMAAFVGDLIFLPSLLVGPLGRFFVLRRLTSSKPGQKKRGSPSFRKAG